MHPSQGAPTDDADEAEASKAHDLAVMAAQDASHRQIGFVDSLDAEQTAELRKMLVAVRDSFANASIVANYWIGVTVTSARIRFGYCPGCGENHTPDALLP